MLQKKNVGNEILKKGRNPPSDVDSSEITEAHEETLPHAKEDWEDPEQREVRNNKEPDLSFTEQT